MPETSQNNYTHGYSDRTIATHLWRTAEVEGAFLIPHIKKTDRILDVGCGPGTITVGFSKYVPDGAIVGVDLSDAVLEKARSIVADAGIPAEGLGSVTFQTADVLAGLPFPDESFDIVFSSQVLPHLPPPDSARNALIEMRRVLKKGGILAARSGSDELFYPRHLAIGRLWPEYSGRVMRHNAPPEAGDHTGANVPALFRSIGFDTDAGKVQFSPTASSISGPEGRKWMASRATGRLQPEDPSYQNWLKMGITPEQIEDTKKAIKEWEETEDAYYVNIQIDTLGWK